MAKLSPTRGFSAELATSFVIMIAAQYGLPVSSSQVRRACRLQLCSLGRGLQRRRGARARGDLCA